MPRLTRAERTQKQIERLEQKKIIVNSKIEVMNKALTDIDAKLATLRNQ